ncbi:mycofactocin system FadH/OYE family oxidoreductase 2 [Antrihabitans cavernicola]|uniref:Mycofactocin system FadH/OYE family oxidoreductase 2 n=1 Tax=Antrihabitans cavernicola TaxID=2495913 RepID=A0A5A7S5G7_9NOCA|nr:mycofactocin system FadH/OYE family oxidoreductase 2 [Spelaeibacter cavernicola]
MSLGPVRLANRVVFAAHLTNFASDGMPTPQHTAYYRARAEGGAGLIITEEQITAPGDRPYEKLIRGYDPAVVQHYRTITDAVHRYGTRIFAQLNHNGGQSSGMYTRAAIVAPSAVPDPLFREVPHAVDTDEIADVIDGFALVARHCVEGGFDGVELQCSQSSILRGFLSGATNRRVDRYGGDLACRARLLLEVVAAVRAAVGDDIAVGVRISGEEHVENGTRLDEAVDVARMLAATRQVDYLNTTVGVATATLHLVEPSMATPRGYANHVPRAIREAVSIPVIGVGRFKDPEQANSAVAEGVCDLVGVVRGQIADPDFVAKARAGSADRIRMCLSCNQECVGRVGTGRWLGCVVNPRAGKESIALQPPRRRASMHVVGAGPAGLQAASTAAQLGHRVVLYERARELGGQIRTAARVPGRVELRSLVDTLAGECERYGVDVHAGVNIDADFLRTQSPAAVVIATGARPVRPAWAGGSATVIDVRDVLEGRACPTGSVLVYDELGFHQGTSVAEHLADSGCEVTIATNAMVVGQDLDSTLDMEGWQRRAYDRRIVELTDVIPIEHVTNTLTLLHHPTGIRSTHHVDWIVCSLHQAPETELWNKLRGSDFELYRIGDAVTPRRANAAILEGDSVARACFSVPQH